VAPSGRRASPKTARRDDAHASGTPRRFHLRCGMPHVHATARRVREAAGAGFLARATGNAVAVRLSIPPRGGAPPRSRISRTNGASVGLLYISATRKCFCQTHSLVGLFLFGSPSATRTQRRLTNVLNTRTTLVRTYHVDPSFSYDIFDLAACWGNDGAGAAPARCAVFSYRNR
jgi:hypothetical protein